MKIIIGNILKPKLIKAFRTKNKTIYSQRKIDGACFGFMKAILGFTRMSVRGINKAKRELGFVLMALNIRKVTAQRAENNQNYKKTISILFPIEIVFFTYPDTLCPSLLN